MTLEQLKTAAAAMKAIGVDSARNGISTIENVEKIGRIENACRYTFRYEATEKQPAYAIETAWVFVDGIQFEHCFSRPLAEGESMEMDNRSQPIRDAEREAAEAKKRAVVVTPPSITFAGDSRWSYLEVD